MQEIGIKRMYFLNYNKIYKVYIDIHTIYVSLFTFISRMFNYGEFKADDDQEQHLNELNRKVEDVYRNCIGDNEANIR